MKKMKKIENLKIYQNFWFFFLKKGFFLKKITLNSRKIQNFQKLQSILKRVLEYQKRAWYSEIEVSIGRSLKKAKGMKEEEKKKKK